MKKTSLQIIKCECGAEILLLPDVKEMSRAIQKHANEHARKEKTPEKAKATREHIENLLTQKVLKKASQKNHTTKNPKTTSKQKS